MYTSQIKDKLDILRNSNNIYDGEQNFLRNKNNNTYDNIPAEENELVTLMAEDTEETEHANKEFIKRLVNDYIHFKIYGNNKSFNRNKEGGKKRKEDQEQLRKDAEKLSNSRSNNTQKTERFRRVSRTLRTVSVELEKNHSEFFDNMCSALELQTDTAETTFQMVSEEVLELKTLNWGRVVSLFTFGGRLAEWFWEQQEMEKVEEVEEWLTESLSSKEDWIERNGGWDGFYDMFTPDNGYRWLKTGLLICLGVSLTTALFTLRK